MCVVGMDQPILEASVYGALKEAIKPLLRLASCHITGIFIPGASSDPSIVEDFCISLLDSGAISINFFVHPGDTFLDLRMIKAFAGQFPRTRTGVYLDAPITSLDTLDFLAEQLKDSVSYFFLATQIDETATRYYERSKEIVSSSIEVHIIFKSTSTSTPTTKDIIKFATIHENIHTCVISSIVSADRSTTLLNPMTPSQFKEGAIVDLLSCFIGCLKSDRPDGLFTTVVCDESNVSLGLVYSNQESIRAAICEGKGIYWSRSRGGLWRKGDTSGMHQQLLRVRYAYIYTCSCIYSYTCTHVHIHTYIHTYICIYTFAHVFIHTYVHT